MADTTDGNGHGLGFETLVGRLALRLGLPMGLAFGIPIVYGFFSLGGLYTSQTEQGKVLTQQVEVTKSLAAQMNTLNTNDARQDTKIIYLERDKTADPPGLYPPEKRKHTNQ